MFFIRNRAIVILGIVLAILIVLMFLFQKIKRDELNNQLTIILVCFSMWLQRVLLGPKATIQRDCRRAVKGMGSSLLSTCLPFFCLDNVYCSIWC